jgi:general secretion pathway protein B
MSFILDALRKSEHDRERRILPGLVEAPRAQRKNPLLGWIVGLLATLLILNTIALLYFLLRAPAPVAGPVALPAAAPSAAVAATAPSGPAAVYTPPPINPAVTHRPTRSLADEAAASGRTAPYTDVPPIAARPLPTPHREPAGVTPLAETDGGAAGLPSRRQLPAALASALPALSVDLHVFSSNPAQRFMVVSGQRVQEGASLAGGVVIEKITPDGAIAVFRGTRFLLTRE